MSIEDHDRLQCVVCGKVMRRARAPTDWEKVKRGSIYPAAHEWAGPGYCPGTTVEAIRIPAGQPDPPPLFSGRMPQKA